MKIFVADHCGFCYGVKRAVQLARSVQEPQPVQTLGSIIHNPQVVADLAKQGIKPVYDLDKVDRGTIIFRSHGVSPAVYAQAERQKLRIVDATCPHVKKAQLAAKQFVEQGYEVAVVGEADHPEVQSIVAWAGKPVAVIQDEQDAYRMSFVPRLAVVSQTTLDSGFFSTILGILKEKCQELAVGQTICTATRQRQESAITLAKHVDVMIVVGGLNSANTRHLAKVCAATGTPTHHIETANDLKSAWYAGHDKKVGVTAGASTPDWIIEEVVKTMEETEETKQAEGAEQTQQAEQMYEVKPLEEGAFVKGKVVTVTRDEVMVDIGYKAEGVIPVEELAYPRPEDAATVVQPGDEITVCITKVDNGEGVVLLSKIKADASTAWETVLKAMEEKQALSCGGAHAVKGGVVVRYQGIRGFIPASQVDLHRVEDLSTFNGQTLEVIPIEVDAEKRKLVLSRRKVLEAQRQQQRDVLMDTLVPNQIVKGVVRRLTTYGAFVDIGGVDGLLHISEMSWERVNKPEDVLSVGDEIQVMILKVDEERGRISLSLKHATRDPWFEKVEQYVPGQILTGTVTKTTGFGAFVKLPTEVEGLVHISQISPKRINTVEEALSVGDTVKVKILEIDQDRKKISLSIKAVDEDAQREQFDDYVSGKNNTRLTLGDAFGHLFKKNDD